GQPGAARPAPGMAAAARRDPALAPAWHRLAASTLDWFIIILVSVIAFWSPLSQIWREVRAIATHYQDLTSPAAQAAINSISRDPANERTLVYWLLVMFGIALVYYWVQHAAWGATVGKRVLGLRVVRAADRSRIGVRQAGIRTVAFLAGPAILMLLVTPFNIVGGVLWAADASLPLLDSQAQSLHDKLAGTVVVRQRWLDQRSRGS
ncbi:MAG: RDD family protein, partial [Streptosporangiaceae bacterium]